MKALNFYILLVLIGLSLSCRKKEYPEPEEIIGEAVYFSRLTVNNAPVNLEAGVNGYYMYSSYKQDSNNVYSFIGDLKPTTTCDNCPGLRVQINDTRVSPFNAPAKIDSALRIGAYTYMRGFKEAAYTVQYNAAEPASSYHWDFGDGTSSEEKNPSHTYARAGKYNVCLTTSNNSCVSSICNKEKIDVSGRSCKTAILASQAGGNTMSFTHSTSGGQAPYQFFWSFGDGSTSSADSPVRTYKYSGSYPVTLRVVDALGDTAIANYNVITQNDNSSCAANYYKTSFTQIPNHLALSSVIVTWTDTDGTVYTSNSPLQSSDASFQIVSIAGQGQENENGQAIRKLSVRFKCKVFNGSRFMSIDNAEAIICVAYKN